MEETGNNDIIPEKRKGSNSPPFNMKEEVFGWLESIIISVIAVALIITFVGRIVMVDGTSMVPTLHDQERIITTPLYASLNRGDIVVIRRNGDVPLVKRVVGVAGETVNVDYANNRVLVNGTPLEEGYLAEEMFPTQYDPVKLPIRVPEGCVFVLGDNRNHSSDSRYPSIGLIDTRNVFGKAVCRIWPLDRVGGIG